MTRAHGPGRPDPAVLRGLGGAGRSSVAVEGALFVGAGGGGGAVGVQGEVPAPAVDGGEVVEGAEQDQVVQAGGAAVAAGSEVVGLAGGGALAAAGEPAAAVPGDHGAAQVIGDGLGRFADVQRQADAARRRRRGGRCARTRPARPGRTADPRHDAAAPGAPPRPSATAARTATREVSLPHTCAGSCPRSVVPEERLVSWSRTAGSTCPDTTGTITRHNRCPAPRPGRAPPTPLRPRRLGAGGAVQAAS